MKASTIGLLIVLTLHLSCLKGRANILLLYRRNIPFYLSTINFLKEHLDTGIIECSIDDPCLIKDEPYDLIVSFGNRASYYALNTVKSEKLILAFFLNDYSLPAKYPQRNIKFFFLFPSLQETLERLSTRFPGTERLLVIYTGHSRHWTQTKLPSDLRVRVRMQEIECAELLREARRIFQKDFDLVVLAPDHIFLQKKVLKHLTKLSYITRKPVVGFTRAMLDYGFPVVVYYDLEEMKENVARTIREYLTRRVATLDFQRARVLLNEEALRFFPSLKRMLRDVQGR